MSDETRTAIEIARKVLETEGRAVLGLVPELDSNFERCVDLLEACRGRVIVTGMGKSGIIARKIAATLSSTGTSAIFLHAAEAVHGDLGVVQTDDLVMALSYSGETEELIRLLEAIRRIGARLLALTGSPRSTLAQASDATLNCEVAEEACLMNLAPTASTTAMLAMGDAVAVALSRRKGFRSDQFAHLHPAGPIGKRLMRVEALMHSGDALPRVGLDTLMPDVIHEMSSKRLGMACVLDAGGRLEGVVTDGDLRRHMLTAGPDSLARPARDVMTRHPVTVEPHLLAVEALRVMEQRKITAVVIVQASGSVVGVVHLHDLWRIADGLMPLALDEVHARAARLRLLLLDVDGVLTNGTVTIDSSGGESKAFSIRDGAAIVWAGREDLEIGLLSGRPSLATSRRAAELGLRLVFQPGPEKLRGYDEVVAASGLADDQIGYMGDDLLDLGVLRRVGLSAAPADAVDDVRSRVHWVSRFPGGGGAVREMIELILRAQGKWDRMLQTFLPQ